MQGRLKSNVNVAFGDDMVRVRYALWEIALPISWVDSKPFVRELLEGKRAKGEAMVDRETNSLIQLLDAQGCFVPDVKTSYTLREVRSLFDPLRSEWYSAYYAHPIWDRIRTGIASRNELLAWVLHNYHVSRAAGIVGARMAATNSRSKWGKFFEHDALDEYWHCDAYYFIDAPNLRVRADAAKAYVQLPSSLAFEQHTLQVAEHDPLGHILIAYFQESSITFQDDSNAFYRHVEDVYEIPNFFRSWKQHIRIDIDHHHAEGLGALLNSDVEVDAATLTLALRNAWLAFAFLMSSLDEIRNEERKDRDVRLRLPFDDCRLDRSLSALLTSAPIELDGRNKSFSNLQGLYEWYTSATAGLKISTNCSNVGRSMEYLRQGLARSGFRALGFSRHHDEVMACGRLASILSVRTGGEALPVNLWEVAIVNYLCEAATSPVGWTMLLDLLFYRVNQMGPVAYGGWVPYDRLAVANRLRSDTPLSLVTADRWLTSLAQLDELILSWVASKASVPENLIIS